MASPIYVNGKVVGRVVGGVFFKSVRGSAHFLRVPPAIAFDVSSLDDAEKAGARGVSVVDKETGTTYQATMKVIREDGFPVNRGHGSQIALPMDKWVKSGSKQLSMELA